ncbi:hypothetical protein FY528_00095 [Hymenobacter lutimineralis]|uniref:Transporter-associated domain-containing protein n=1 Tax=Hymenobacter lutimineralis TaxID=2606448 RepID=A0A5D6VDN4_9BACT|nr:MULTISPECIES: hypothetical protein [Hymenobacter]QIX60409.1 hypothetical protein HER32_04080 [Hymenobacter sp. BT18]TYZ14171.1 hypothetical protein FY528_00095 [Hymenobacter lutimineralis]
MNIVFDLNLDHSFAEEIRQQHEAREAHELISDLEDKIGAAISGIVSLHGVLPAVGDRLEVEDQWVVISVRSFGRDGSVWLAAKRFEAS